MGQARGNAPAGSLDPKWGHGDLSCPQSNPHPGVSDAPGVTLGIGPYPSSSPTVTAMVSVRACLRMRQLWGSPNAQSKGIFGGDGW